MQGLHKHDIAVGLYRFHDLRLSRRAGIAAAAFCMQLALGSVYGWSVFLNPLQDAFGASRAAVNLTFTITLAVLGLTAGLGGSLQRRIGPRATATLAGVLYGLGTILSGLAPNLPVLYVTHGVMGGIGLGLGYIVPLAVLLAWFPDRRGFISGLAVTGFGLGALIVSPLATVLIKVNGVENALMILGTVYFIVVVSAAQAMRSAPDNYVPPGWTPARQQAAPSGRSMTLAQALRTPHWHLLWWMLALNITAGAALISVAAPLAQELTQVGPALGAAAVGAIALFNGVVRLLWGTLSDSIGRARTFLTLFLIQAVTFALMPAIDGFNVLLISFATVAVCYGGGFGTMPAFASDVFGARNAGTIYGAMLSAWSVGAIAGPMLISAVPARTALALIAVLLAIAAALPLAFTATGRFPARTNDAPSRA